MGKAAYDYTEIPFLGSVSAESASLSVILEQIFLLRVES